jgi:hypothetical protein
MKTGIEQSNHLWNQLNEELLSGSIESVDTSTGNLYLYVAGRKNRWAIVVAGTMSVASNPAVDESFDLEPEMFAGYNINQLRPAYDDGQTWDVDQENKFLSYQNASLEILGKEYSFMLQCEHFGISMMEPEKD